MPADKGVPLTGFVYRAFDKGEGFRAEENIGFDPVFFDRTPKAGGHRVKDAGFGIREALQFQFIFFSLQPMLNIGIQGCAGPGPKECLPMEKLKSGMLIGPAIHATPGLFCHGHAAF